MARRVSGEGVGAADPGGGRHNRAPEMRPVIGGPREREKIALPLAGPQRQNQRQLHFPACRGQQPGDVRLGPNLVAAIGGIEPTAALARVFGAKTARSTLDLRKTLRSRRGRSKKEVKGR
jgi:hypothetical protein